VRTHAQKYFLKLHKHGKEYISVSQGNTAYGVSMAHADPNQPKRKVQGTTFTLRAPKQRRLSEGSALSTSSDEEESLSEPSQSRHGSVDYTDSESTLAASSSSSSATGTYALSGRPRREKAGNRLKQGRFASPSPKSVMEMDSPRCSPSKPRGVKPTTDCAPSSPAQPALPVSAPRPEPADDAADWFTLPALPARTQPAAAGPYNLFPASLLDQPALAATSDPDVEVDPFGFGPCDLAALDYHWLSAEEEDTLAMTKSEMRMNLAAVTQALAMGFTPEGAMSAFHSEDSSSSSSMTSGCSSSDDGWRDGQQGVKGVKEVRQTAHYTTTTTTTTAPTGMCINAPVPGAYACALAEQREWESAPTSDDDDGMDERSVVSGILEAFSD
jgi:hypothetical protein